MKKFRILFMALVIIIGFSFSSVNAEEIGDVLVKETEVEKQTVVTTDTDITSEEKALEVIEETENTEVEESTTEKDPEAGEVTGEKTAEVVTGEGEDGRSADVTIEVDGNDFTTYDQDPREIVLVLDDSGSMDYATSETDATTRLANLKIAAEEMINSLFAEENNNQIKVGIIYYGSIVKGTCVLTTDKDSLMVCLNAMDGNGGTNVQAGIKEAKDLFTTSTTSEKSIILLTDGEPTYYDDEKGLTHGTGNSDDYENTNYYTKTNEGNININGKNYYKITYNYYLEKEKETLVKTCAYLYDYETKEWDSGTCTTYENESKEVLKPSTAANNEADEFKDETQTPNGTIYTVGFAIEENSAEETFLKSIATDEDKYFLATSLEQLKAVFAAIKNSIFLIATDVKVVDIIPNTFEIDEKYMEDTFKTVITNDDGSKTYGGKVNVKETEDGTILTWLINDLLSTDTNKLTFRIKAVADYYGNMFTNDGAVITGVAVDSNPFYGETNAIEVNLKDPTVAIPAVTADDSYTTNQGETLTVNAVNGVRKNDYKSVQTDDNAEVVDEVIKVLNVTKGSLTLNSDGSFTYVAPTNYYGDVTFTYYIETTVNVNGKTFIVKSNTSTATIAINRIPTTYVVHHYIKGTEIRVENTVDDIGTGYVYEEATGNAKTDLTNYVLVTGSDASQTITLEKTNNVIIFYYELKNAGKVTVYYYENGTTNTLSPKDEISGKVTTTYKSENRTIPNWTLVAIPNNANGTFTLNEQTVVYYYAKTMGKVIVHYVDENGNTLSADVETSGQINVDSYTTTQETIANWTFKEVKTGSAETSGKYTTGTLEVTYVYTKTMGKVIVHYVDENGKVLTEKIITEGQVNVDTYLTEKLSFDNYNFVKVEGEETGTYTEEDTIVTYVYSYNDPIPNTGIVDNNIEEIIFVTALLTLVCYVVLKRKVIF